MRRSQVVGESPLTADARLDKLTKVGAEASCDGVGIGRRDSAAEKSAGETGSQSVVHGIQKIVKDVHARRVDRKCYAETLESGIPGDLSIIGQSGSESGFSRGWKR